jgi:transposase
MGGADVANVRTFVGLDAHARQTQGAAIDRGTGEIGYRRVNGAPREALAYLESLPAPVLAAYESGPVGYGLARAAEGLAEIEVRVCAPGSIPRRNDRIKTDRRDAERLARLLLAGELGFVRVPTPDEERFRDLCRCREAVRRDLMRARHRLTHFLVRRELRFEGPAKPWTARHRGWLRGIELPDRPSRTVLDDYRAAVAALEQRRDVLDETIADCWQESPWAEQIARLRCLRGIETLSALGLCAEVGCFERFEHPSQLAGYLGIVPSEHSSGETKRRGPITKAGSAFARRLLVEAAQHYRHRPGIGARLAQRQHGQDPRACEIGLRAQQRLHRRWLRLHARRGKPSNIVIVGMARELCSFVWEVGRLT